jgi:hypothetical protein
MTEAPHNRSRELLSALVAFKVLYLGFIVVSLLLLPGFFNHRGYSVNFHWPAEKQPGLIERFTTWDSEHYLFLAANGYVEGSPSVAFYPLWPGLIAAIGRVFAGQYWLAGLVLSNAFSLGAWLLFHRLVTLEHGEQTGDWATAFLIAFPGALFFQLPYTESLFLLLVVLLFYGMRTDNDRLIAIAGVLLPLTRVIGLLCILPIAIHSWQRRKVSISAVASIPAGFAIYLAIMVATTGNLFAGFAAQQHYKSHGSIAKLLDVPAFLSALASPGHLHGFLDSAIDRLFFLVFIAALVPIWRMSKPWFAYAVAAGLVPAIANSFMSYTRYLAVVFPLFVVAADVFAKPSRRGWRLVALASLLALQLLFVLRHTNFIWAG